ncbi:transmembrane protein 230 [Penaeus vannamei]|uniref:transmembrane protein 230 n=1 Tax=Penaeus vannamei TaxID=6689 RepID=UPI00387F912F
MVRKDANSYPSAKYQKLCQEDDGFVDAQFKTKAQRIPWKAIGYALVLFSAGTLLLVIGSLLVTGYIEEKYADRTWPVIILGALMFIPGAYHSYIAYYAFRGYEGFSFDDIPSFEDE